MEPGAAPDPRRWRALALVCVAFFMVILDVAIVNVALPSIQEDLGISRDTLQWIVTAYSLAFGGFLLLGGRAADLLGRRKVFMFGMVLFTGGSLACGLADSGTQLIIFRAIQGLGGAIVSPATLAIISDSFRHDQAERNKAFGIWGAVAGSGAAAGVLLGGILVEYLGWEAIFFVNVPVGVAIFALAPTLISEGRVEGADRRVDVLGAALVTSGLVLFVYAMSEAPDAGWGSAQTLGLTAVSVALVAAFFWWEARTPTPIVPLGLFRIRPVFVANTVGVLLGATLFGGFFLLTLYMQTVLGYSALEAGLAFLATAGMTIPRRGDRASRRHARGREARDDGRHRVPGLRVPLVHAAAGRRDVLEEPVHPVRDQRLRPGVHLHPHGPRSALPHRGSDRRCRLGPAQHLAAARRCGRCRADLDDLQRASRHARGRRRGPVVGADRRLQLGLRGRLGLRAARRGRRLGSPQARRRSGRGRPATRPRGLAARPGLLHQLRRRDLDVSVLEDPRELVPVELPVEAQAEPAAVPEVRRTEEPLGVGLDEHLLNAALGRSPQRERPVAVVVVQDHREGALVPDEKGRVTVAQPLAGLRKGEAELADAIEDLIVVSHARTWRTRRARCGPRARPTQLPRPVRSR